LDFNYWVGLAISLGYLVFGIQRLVNRGKNDVELGAIVGDIFGVIFYFILF
jgi:hypothetical protein